MSDTLHDALDEAWRDLIARCRATGPNGEQIAVDQHIEALVAASKWAEIRAKIAPADVGKEKSSRFDRIREEFHGKRRGGRPPANRAADGDGNADEASAAPTVNGAGSADEAGPVN